MSEGYAEIAGAMSLDGWLQFSGVVMQDGGYLKTEAEKLMTKKPDAIRAKN
jgi:hypothetical protein